MDWKCSDCGRPEKIVWPEQISEGERIYLVCDGCGALYYIDFKRSKDSLKRDAWGIPKSSAG